MSGGAAIRVPWTAPLPFRPRGPEERRRARWNALVTRALAAIRAGALDKVVLARAIDVDAEGPLDPGDLLAALQSATRPAAGFSFAERTPCSWALRPRVLCRVEGDQVRGGRLAGSAPGGSGSPAREWEGSAGAPLGRRSHCPRARGHRRPGAPTARARVRASQTSRLHTPVVARLAPGRGVADVAAALTRRLRWAAFRRLRRCASWRARSASTADSTPAWSAGWAGAAPGWRWRCAPR